MSQFTFAGNATTVQLLAAVSAANTAAATGGWVDIRAYDTPLAIVQNGGLGTGTLDGKIQDATDISGTGVADVSGATFTQKTTTVNQQVLALQPRSTRGFIRYLGTVGTGPQLVGVDLVGVKKIAP